jgi:hypothetical protein
LEQRQVISGSSFAAVALIQVALQIGAETPAVEPGPVASARAEVTMPLGHDAHDGASGNTVVLAPAARDAEIRIDGILDEAAWADAPLLTGFTQYEPVEGIAATQGTEVRVLVTDDAILFGIRAHDEDAGGIRSTLARRDGFGGSDDWVRVKPPWHSSRRTVDQGQRRKG